MQIQSALPNVDTTPTLLSDLGLVDTVASEAFDAITRLAIQIFQTPVALVSIVEEELDRQFFTSQVGLPEPWASTRQTPLSHSFCQHVKREGRPLIVRDARCHNLVKDNLAIPVLGVIAYLGVPVIGPDNTPIGALCVIESEPRDWTEHECELLKDLALCVRDEIKLRLHILHEKAEHKSALNRQRMTVAMTQAFSARGLSPEQRFTEMLHAGCDLFGMTSSTLARTDFNEFVAIYAYRASQDADDFPVEKVTSAAKQVAALQYCIAVHDTELWPEHSDPDIGCYLGHPLIMNGVFFGVLEFHSVARKSKPWTVHELSLLGMMASLACAELSAFDQIETLKRTEDALIRQVYGTSDTTKPQ